MKKIIIHSVPVVTSFVWLFTTYQTLNPIILKGPDFLTFYAILILGFYASVFINSSKERGSKITFYFAGLIFLLGLVKLFRGIMLGKPIGFLFMILMTECIVTLVFISNHINKKIK
ncbi:hypothetical protein F3J23_10085 [Chryseobacterium sp. Tr-659]|nr:hypothetical protein [Chryseobacterium sp. Tr-659]